jgi:hypothetical protein
VLLLLVRYNHCSLSKRQLSSKPISAALSDQHNLFCSVLVHEAGKKPDISFESVI